MHAIDWLLVCLPLAVVFGFAVYTNRYVKSVADFLSAGRCAGRYLLANAKGESESGLSSSISVFEMIVVSGFVVGFWDKLSYPIALLVAISGFVIYRFRETRALTLAQFLEIRYSRRFRLFMGVLAFISGILNYGVFPGISARFLIFFLDLPPTVHGVSTFALIMFCYLACTVFLVLVGGQATMMITCCLEGLYSQLAYLIIAIAVFCIVSWRHIIEVMSHAAPGMSQLNPFDSSHVPDFNIWFIVMALCHRIYGTMAMQQKQGFNSAARTPHESRMGAVLGEWRGYAKNLMLLVLAVCAMTYLNHSDFAQHAPAVRDALHHVGDEYLQEEAKVSIALRFMLPVGIKGLFLSIMIMGLLSGDGGHLHSWGSIFIQDVILPLKKKPLTPRQHIWVLRIAITGVATLAFLFSVTFTLKQAVQLWWMLTAALFVGGAGAAIIGGLYWRRGTTAGAWAGALTGSALAVAGIITGNYWPWLVDHIGPTLDRWNIHLPAKFWFNYQVSGFIAECAGASTYAIVSLLTCRTPFNLNQMLHRGEYAVEPDAAAPVGLRHRLSLKSILRFDENFTRGDKFVAGGIFWWAMTLATINVVAAVWNLKFSRWSIQWWANYWLILAIAIPFGISLLTLVWFTIGGVRDIREFFVALRTMKRDARDDGRVVGHHNLADEGRASEVIPTRETRRALVPSPGTPGEG
jgi:SSS family solute:Na+ symporter